MKVLSLAQRLYHGSCFVGFGSSMRLERQETRDSSYERGKPGSCCDTPVRVANLRRVHQTPFLVKEDNSQRAWYVFCKVKV